MRLTISPIWSLSRAGNWWHYKIPPLLAVGYAAMLFYQIQPQTGLLALFVLLFCICAAATYGHIVNDVFDIEEDRRRGKSNFMAEFSKLQRVSIALFFVAVAFAPLAWMEFGWFATALLAINFLLPTIYSAPPFRLKERGIWGILADAAGVHGVPTLFFAASLTHVAGNGAGASALIITATTWSFLAGLRGIIVHQVVDRESDRSAGVRTFAGSMNLDRLRFLVLRLLVPCELVAFGAFVWLLLPFAFFLIVVLPIYLILEGVKFFSGWTLPLFYPDSPSPEPYRPWVNNEFYEVWLPLTLATQLALLSPWLLFLPALQILLFYPNVKARSQVLIKVMHEIGKHVRELVQKGGH